MTSIPLALVVAFLRPRGALGVLDGAPYFEPTSACPLDMRALQTVEDTYADAVLYLGSGEVCAAAEGWAIRVLLMTLGVVPEVIRQGGLFGVCTEGVALYWPAGGDRLARQVWSWCPVQVTDWRRMYEPLAMPSTPAERLAAVLIYELGRKR